jgi:uncharacterized membrane protein YbhN (UPF0104 family)
MASIVVSVALLAGVLVFLMPNLPDVSAVWSSVSAMSWPELALLAAVAAWNLLTYCLVTAAATPGLTLRQAFVVTQSSTAVANTVPAGSAISIGLTYAILGSWGFSKSRSTVSLVVTGVWNNFVKLGTPVLALALLAFEGEATPPRVLAGIVGIGVLVATVATFALMLRTEAFAGAVGRRAAALASPVHRLLHRPPAQGWDRATVDFRHRVVGLVRHSWLRLTITTLVSHLSLFVLLLVVLRGVGVPQSDVSWIQALAVFAFVRLLTAVPVMPGGLGFVELGLIGGLQSAGGDPAPVVAAVLVFRSLTFLLPIGIGLGTYVFWRRNRSWRGSAASLDPSGAPEAMTP